MQQVEITEPIYLLSQHNNIPLDEGWNRALSRALNDLTTELAKNDKDVQDVSVDKDDNFIQEIKARGSIGYSVLADPGQTPDSYYVDFSVAIPEHGAYDYKQEREGMSPLLDALAGYIKEENDYSLLKCYIFSHSLDSITLRAYFVKNASS